MTCSPGISPNGSPLQKSPLPDSSTPQPALGFLTISLHTIDHQPRGAITFAHNGCRKLRAYAYDSSCLTVSTFNLGGHRETGRIESESPQFSAPVVGESDRPARLMIDGVERDRKETQRWLRCRTIRKGAF